MADSISNFFLILVDYAWGMPLVVLLIGSGLFFLLYSRFLPFRGLKHSIDIILGKYDDKSDPGEVSHFQALCSCLAATIGMGNIAGVAVGLHYGGPGAVFWMWIAGLVGMATKYFDCTLSVMFRQKDEDGVDQGGPMYYIVEGMGKKFWPLAVFFSVCGLVGCLSLFQTNQVGQMLHEEFSLAPNITGIIFMILTAIVIFGGIKRIGEVSSKIVPLMSILYILATCFIIISRFEMLPGIIFQIIHDAFTGTAAMGGAAGIAVIEVIKTGVKRAAFSNEAGIGTAPMAHGAAKTKEPVREGLVAMIGPFVDTNIICTLTALTILATGVDLSDSNGISLTMKAFTIGIPVFGRPLLIITSFLFAITTVFGYCYYGTKCYKFLFGKKTVVIYQLIYLAGIYAESIMPLDTILNIVDTFFAFMAIPNLIATLWLSPHVMRATKDYFTRLKNNAFSLQNINTITPL